jgi:hypothetical protein
MVITMGSCFKLLWSWICIVYCIVRGITRVLANVNESLMKVIYTIHNGCWPKQILNVGPAEMVWCMVFNERDNNNDNANGIMTTEQSLFNRHSGALVFFGGIFWDLDC